MAIPLGNLEVKSKDPRINYNLLPGEVLQTCPYNLSHAILPIKFARHVLNCHRLHLKEQQAKGETSKFSICQYDRSHHVRNEELAHHEETCKSTRYDGWDDWDDSGKKEEAKGAAAASASIPNVTVKLREPPKLDPETLANIHREDWDADADYDACYDNARGYNPNKRIHELRSRGYDYIKTDYVIGKTKSEKKQFYAQEAKVLESYNRHHKFVQLGGNEGEGATTPGYWTKHQAVVNSATPLAGSMYGDGAGGGTVPTMPEEKQKGPLDDDDWDSENPAPIQGSNAFNELDDKYEMGEAGLPHLRGDYSYSAARENWD